MVTEGVLACFHEKFHDALRKLFSSKGRVVTLSENDVKTRENFTSFFTSDENFHEIFHGR